MILWPRGRREIRGEDERAKCGLRAADAAGIGSPVAADITCVPPQRVGGVAFEVVPDLLRGIELGGIRRELLQRPPGVALTHGLDRRPTMNRTTVPEAHDMAPQMSQERAEEVGHVGGREVARLPAEG